MNPHLDEQGAIHMHMHANDFACMHSCVHLYMPRNTHLLFCPLSITSTYPPTHTASGGKRKCLFKGWIQQDELRHFNLTYAKPGAVYSCRETQRGATTKNVISPRTRQAWLSYAENKMQSLLLAQSYIPKINRRNEMKDKGNSNCILWLIFVFLLKYVLVYTEFHFKPYVHNSTTQTQNKPLYSSYKVSLSHLSHTHPFNPCEPQKPRATVPPSYSLGGFSSFRTKSFFKKSQWKKSPSEQLSSDRLILDKQVRNVLWSKVIFVRNMYTCMYNIEKPKICEEMWDQPGSFWLNIIIVCNDVTHSV